MDRQVVQMSGFPSSTKGSGRQDPNLAPETAIEQDMELRREEAEIQRELRHAHEGDRTPERRWWQFWKR
jgi:hypothetical protein